MQSDEEWAGSRCFVANAPQTKSSWRVPLMLVGVAVIAISAIAFAITLPRPRLRELAHYLILEVPWVAPVVAVASVIFGFYLVIEVIGGREITIRPLPDGIE